jgi:hypothetical protein
MPDPIGWILNEASRLQGGLSNFANTGGLDARIRALFGNPVRAAAPAAPTTPSTFVRDPRARAEAALAPIPTRNVPYTSLTGGNPRNVTGGTAPGSFDYRAMKQGAAGESQQDYSMEDLLALLGLGGGGADNSLAWAQMEMERQQWADRMALEQQQMAQAAELARLEREQRAREMAASIGQFLANQSSQNWNAGLPWTLPRGTQYAPGFEPGGPAARLAQIGGAQYTPPPLAVSNPPSRETMAAWVDEALQQFGR